MNAYIYPDDAACAGHPLPLWDASVHGETAAEREARHHQAAAICRTCPVGAACLDAAETGVDEGVRNGMNLPPLRPSRRGNGRGPTEFWRLIQAGVNWQSAEIIATARPPRSAAS